MKRAYKIGLGLFFVIAIVLTTVALTVGTINIGTQQPLTLNATYFQYSSVISLQNQLLAKLGMHKDVSSFITYNPFARQSIPTNGTVQDIINNLQNELNEFGQHHSSSPKDAMERAVAAVRKH
jgi:hypothetical protein